MIKKPLDKLSREKRKSHQNNMGMEYVPANWAENGNIFCLIVEGKGMEPRMFEGDILIVRSQNDVESGEIAVVMVDGAACVTKVIKHPGGILLTSFNVDYPPMFFTIKDMKEKNIEIVGKVLELRAKFEE